jgi:4-hydroxybutyrate CoA-transferase
VSVNRYDVHYIVTEYGHANLRGLTLRDRARALIEISHPDFRDILKEEFKNRFHTSKY